MYAHIHALVYILYVGIYNNIILMYAECKRKHI